MHFSETKYRRYIKKHYKAYEIFKNLDEGGMPDFLLVRKKGKRVKKPYGHVVLVEVKKRENQNKPCVSNFGLDQIKWFKKYEGCLVAFIGKDKIWRHYGFDGVNFTEIK